MKLSLFLLSFIFPILARCDIVIPIPAELPTHLSQRLHLTSFEEMQSFLSKGDLDEMKEGKPPLHYQILEHGQIFLSIPVMSVPQRICEKYSPYFDNSGELAISWESEFRFVAIVEKYYKSHPRGLIYWIDTSRPFILDAPELIRPKDSK